MHRNVPVRREDMGRGGVALPEARAIRQCRAATSITRIESTSAITMPPRAGFAVANLRTRIRSLASVMADGVLSDRPSLLQPLPTVARLVSLHPAGHNSIGATEIPTRSARFPRVRPAVLAGRLASPV